MNPESLERIKKLDKERTQGTWSVDDKSDEHGEWRSIEADSAPSEWVLCWDGDDKIPSQQDAAFIAECSTAVPELIKEVSRLRQALGNIKGLKSGPVSGGKAKLQFDRAVWIARDALAPPPPKKVVDAQERIAQSLRASREALGEEGKS